MASAPVFWPALTCGKPAVCVRSFFNVFITTFPVIRRSTFPTPLGLRPGIFVYRYQSTCNESF